MPRRFRGRREGTPRKHRTLQKEGKSGSGFCSARRGSEMGRLLGAPANTLGVGRVGAPRIAADPVFCGLLRAPFDDVDAVEPSRRVPAAGRPRRTRC
ncbi:unnamed protein product [Amoebophrya sp. A120]|nr:unnamed protein product [Amoebophrya sp. A120]|eukprot:GSA120T00002297001.1